MNSITIETATLGAVDDIVPLFEAYRSFYGCAPDRERARAFLAERFARGESVVFVARDRARAVGFVQLFAMFSTLRLTRTWILEDLFVTPETRKRGIARALLDRAETFARSSGADALSLTTARDNDAAQRVYVNAGWVRDDIFLTYHRMLRGNSEMRA